MGLAAVVAITASLGPAWAAGPDLDEGARLFRDVCANCHGRGGTRRALGKSQPLVTLKAGEVRQTLLDRRADPNPRTMQDRLKGALTPEEIDAVAAYAATLGQ